MDKEEILNILITMVNDRILSCYATWLRIRPKEEEDKERDELMKREIEKMEEVMDFLRKNKQ